MQQKLMQFNKVFITLSELEQFAEEGQQYEQFATNILELVTQKMLQPVKSSGQTYRMPSLHYKYKIVKHSVLQSLRQEIEQVQLNLHSQISLDAYYRLSHEQLQQDLPYIEKIHQFLNAYEWPLDAAPAPERSQMLVGDEKWIQYKGGRRIIERLGLWDCMNVIDVKEPLKFAVNPKNLQENTQYHLIVENKTTYEGLLPALQNTCFSTLIYGAGFEIVGSLSLFDKQLPLPDAQHVFYYFGDVDFSGISIWYLLNKQQTIQLAHSFYGVALQNGGKPIPKKQLKDEEANAAFIQHLNAYAQKQCQELLAKNYYVSQEVLAAATLQEIWQQMSEELR